MKSRKRERKKMVEIWWGLKRDWVCTDRASFLTVGLQRLSDWTRPKGSVTPVVAAAGFGHTHNWTVNAAKAARINTPCCLFMQVCWSVSVVPLWMECYALTKLQIVIIITVVVVIIIIRHHDYWSSIIIKSGQIDWSPYNFLCTQWERKISN